MYKNLLAIIFSSLLVGFRFVSLLWVMSVWECVHCVLNRSCPALAVFHGAAFCFIISILITICKKKKWSARCSTIAPNSDCKYCSVSNLLKECHSLVLLFCHLLAWGTYHPGGNFSLHFKVWSSPSVSGNTACSLWVRQSAFCREGWGGVLQGEALLGWARADMNGGRQTSYGMQLKFLSGYSNPLFCAPGISHALIVWTAQRISMFKRGIPSKLSCL